MARPLKNGLEYFPHDCDASNDEKIESLVSVCGLVGYAFYFRMLERIYRTSTGELDLSDSLQRSIVIKKIGLSEKKFEKILETCLKLKLFDEDLFKSRKSVASSGIQRRFSQVLKMRGNWRNIKSFPQGKHGKENHTGNSIDNSVINKEINKEINKIKENEFVITETQKYYSSKNKQLSESESKVVECS